MEISSVGRNLYALARSHSHSRSIVQAFRHGPAAIKEYVKSAVQGIFNQWRGYQYNEMAKWGADYKELTQSLSGDLVLYMRSMAEELSQTDQTIFWEYAQKPMRECLTQFIHKERGSSDFLQGALEDLECTIQLLDHSATRAFQRGPVAAEQFIKDTVASAYKSLKGGQTYDRHPDGMVSWLINHLEQVQKELSEADQILLWKYARDPMNEAVIDFARSEKASAAALTAGLEVINCYYRVRDGSIIHAIEQGAEATQIFAREAVLSAFCVHSGRRWAEIGESSLSASVVSLSGDLANYVNLLSRQLPIADRELFWRASLAPMRESITGYINNNQGSPALLETMLGQVECTIRLNSRSVVQAFQNGASSAESFVREAVESANNARSLKEYDLLPEVIRHLEAVSDQLPKAHHDEFWLYARSSLRDLMVRVNPGIEPHAIEKMELITKLMPAFKNNPESANQIMRDYVFALYESRRLKWAEYARLHEIQRSQWFEYAKLHEANPQKWAEFAKAKAGPNAVDGFFSELWNDLSNQPYWDFHDDLNYHIKFLRCTEKPLREVMTRFVNDHMAGDSEALLQILNRIGAAIAKEARPPWRGP